MKLYDTSVRVWVNRYGEVISEGEVTRVRVLGGRLSRTVGMSKVTEVPDGSSDFRVMIEDGQEVSIGGI